MARKKSRRGKKRSRSRSRSIGGLKRKAPSSRPKRKAPTFGINKGSYIRKYKKDPTTLILLTLIMVALIITLWLGMNPILDDIIILKYIVIVLLGIWWIKLMIIYLVR